MTRENTMSTTPEAPAEIADIDVVVYIPQVEGVTKANLRDIEELIEKALRDAGFSARAEADIDVPTAAAADAPRADHETDAPCTDAEVVDNSWPGEGAPGSCVCGSPTCTGCCPVCLVHETPRYGHNVHYDA